MLRAHSDDVVVFVYYHGCALRDLWSVVWSASACEFGPFAFDGWSDHALLVGWIWGFCGFSPAAEAEADYDADEDEPGYGS